MTQEDNGFDFSAALKAIQEGKPLLARKASSLHSSKISLKQPWKVSWILISAKKSPPTAAMGRARRRSNR